MAKDASRVPYLAIVALVAVVAIVVLVLNVQPSTEEAVAGEASISQLISSSARCRYVDLSQYTGGNLDLLKGKTFNDICRASSAKSCTAVAAESITYIFNDESCLGGTRWRDTSTVWLPEYCGQQAMSLANMEKSCSPGTVGLEPTDSEYYASRSGFLVGAGVLCCS
ncbi:MAG: hypothetical protein Q8R53_02365 [Nanoarchaeota archaeon]|nr:hypothetical protein [Nanoarchaeota archaeon]